MRGECRRRIGWGLDLLFGALEATDCHRVTVVELRQYTLVPGQREVLIDLFESSLIAPQEACGMQIVATFRDGGDAERFVWIRAFQNMDSRARSLESFYGGPVWRKHRVAANGTMLSSDDVLLLRPAWPGSGFADLRGRAAGVSDQGIVVAMVVTLTHAVGAGDLTHFRAEVAPLIQSAGAGVLACLITEPSVNHLSCPPRTRGRARGRVLRWPQRAARRRTRGSASR